MTAPAAFLVPLALIGAGAGLLMTSITGIVLGGAAPSAAGRAAGVLATVQQFAVTLAVTVGGIVLHVAGRAATTVVLLLGIGLLAGVLVTVAAARDGRR